MFKAILLKEIKSHLGTVTFVVWLGVSCFLVWMALESGYSRYEQKHQHYLDMEREAQESLSKEYDPFVPDEDQFRVLRAPSVLSAIVYGLEGDMPVYMSVNPNGVRSGSEGVGQSMLSLFGELDFLLVIELILGLMAVVQAASLVSSEVENGTLKLMLANPVSRSTVLLGKVLGGYAIVAFVYVFSTLVGLFFLSVRGFPLFDSAVLGPLLLIMAGSLVYLLCIFLVGLIGSILFLHSQVALMLSVSLWAALSFLVPNSARTAAELLCPVEDERVVYLRQKHTREALLKAQREEMNEMFPHLEKGFRSDKDFFAATEAGVAAWARYSNQISKDLTTIAENHHREKQAQESLGKVLSRISPAGSFRLLLTSVAGTGDQVGWRFLQAAWDYQNAVNDKVFAKNPPLSMWGARWGHDIGVETPPTPPLIKALSSGSVLTGSALDIALLFFYTVVLFMLAYMLFMRRSIV